MHQIVIVDPILRGSRLFYSAMAADAFTAAGCSVCVLTRDTFRSKTFDAFFKSADIIQPVIRLPEDFWYGKLDRGTVETLCSAAKARVEDAERAGTRAHIHFCGLDEMFPDVLHALSARFSGTNQSISAFQYNTRYLTAAGEISALSSMRRVMAQTLLSLPGMGLLLLDDRLADGLPAPFGGRVAVLPDPAPLTPGELAAAWEDPLPAQLFQNAHGDEDGRIRVVAVGRQSARKGIRDLLDASALLSDRAAGLYVSGPLEESEEALRTKLQAAKSHGLYWRDAYVDEAEVRRTYRDAHYVCLPYAANFEGSSGVFSNAVAFEKPVIATDHGVLGERVRRHGLGLTYPAGDRRALAELLETLPAPGSKTYDAMAAAAARYHRANDRAAWSKALVSVVEAGIRQTRNLAPAQPSALAQKVAAAPAAAPIHRGAAMQPNVQALIEEAAIAPPALDYAPILLLDTAVASRNMGDHIIMDAIKLFLRFIFPKSLFVTAPTHEYAGSETLKLMESAAHTFVCGTNLLSSNADEYKQWKLSGADAFVLKELTLLGVGWWQYQSAPNAYTSFLYRNILSAKTLHAVRDGYTRRQLGAAGVGNAINTSCPTLWGLTRRHVARLPRAKSDTVVFTFTDYAQKPEADGAILRALAGTYGAVHCWLQGAGDYAYAQKLGVEGVKYIAPTVEAYTEFLRDNDCDYVGTRLHAGVRALQMGRRALVLAVDNRAKEISSDCGLPVLPREDFAAIRAALADGWPMEIAVPYGDINAWIGQFSPGRAVDFESLLDTALHGFDPLEAKPAPQVLPQVRTREPAPAPAPVRTVVDVADHLEREGYAHYTVHIRLPGTATAATLLVFRTAASYGATLRPLPEHQIDPDAFAGLSMESDRYGPFVRLFFMADSAEVLASADLGENGGALLAWLAARLGDCANGTARYLHHARIADRGGAEAFITAAARALLACMPSAAGGTHTAAQRAKDRVSL